MCTLVYSVVKQMDFIVLRFVRRIASAWNVLIQVQNYRTFEISNIWQMVLASLKQNPFSELKHKKVRNGDIHHRICKTKNIVRQQLFLFAKGYKTWGWRRLESKRGARGARSCKMLVESLKIAASQLLLGIFLRCSDQASEFLPTASPPFDR